MYKNKTSTQIKISDTLSIRKGITIETTIKKENKIQKSNKETPEYLKNGTYSCDIRYVESAYKRQEEYKANKQKNKAYTKYHYD